MLRLGTGTIPIMVFVKFAPSYPDHSGTACKNLNLMSSQSTSICPVKKVRGSREDKKFISLSFLTLALVGCGWSPSVSHECSKIRNKEKVISYWAALNDSCDKFGER